MRGSCLRSPDQSDVQNRLLSAMPADEFEHLAPSLNQVDLDLGMELQKTGAPIEHVYFPEAGFISALAVLSDSQSLEIGLIGAEGIAGVSVILGAETSHGLSICQTGGSAWRLSAARLKEACHEGSVFRNLLLRYVDIFHIQVAQTAACNAHHDLSQRLARWLLGAHDRSAVNRLSLTQDLIAAMLGVRRSTVSVAAGQLQKAGLIRYQHGSITIVDRAGLERAACECYNVVASAYRQFFAKHAKPVEETI